MSIVRVGTTKKYADNWDNIFGGTGGVRTTTKKKPARVAKSAKASAKKKPAQKNSAAKPARRTARKK